MDPKIQALHEAFNNMNYRDTIEDLSEGSTWLDSTEIIDGFNYVNYDIYSDDSCITGTDGPSDDGDNTGSDETNDDSDNIDSDRYNDSDNIDNTFFKSIEISTQQIEKRYLISLAEEIKKKSNLITHIEILSRGILSKDTKQSVEIIAKYLHYYATFIKKNTDKPKGLNVAIFDDYAPLWLLAFSLAPALAHGYTILLQTGPRFADVVSYILELAKNVGISENSIILISSDYIGLQQYLNNEQVTIITLFIDLLDSEVEGINKFNKKILVFSPYKSPMIIFDDADLDSAIESVIEAAWGYQGQLPWAIDTVLIQENIFNKIVDKLKNKITSLYIGYSCDKNTDIAFPTNPVVIENRWKYIKNARDLNIEVYEKPCSCYAKYTPTLIIGSKASTNNIIQANENNGCITIVPFRSIDEAVNLANNSRQGLGASVWAENVGLINEVSRKLKVNNVWVNAHGLLSPEIPITPFKDSGVGCFGSSWGIAEYINVVELSQHNVTDLPQSFKIVEEVKNAIKLGKTASDSWWKKPLLEKMMIFEQIQYFFDDEKLKHRQKLPETFFTSVINIIDEGIHNIPQFGTFALDSYTISSIKEPKGVLVVEMKKDIDNHYWKIAVAGLLEGNAVIILNEAAEVTEFYQDLSKLFPTGCLTILPYSLDAVKTCSLYKDLGGYFASETNIIFGSMPLADSKIFVGINDESWHDAFRKVTLIKNVWSNIGKSFQCNL